MTAAEIREQTAKHLLPHEMPDAFEIVETYPLNNSGKIDRTQLEIQATLRRTAA